MALTGIGVIVLVGILVVIIAVIKAVSTDEKKQAGRDARRELAVYKRFAADIQDLAVQHADVYGEMSMYINDRLRKLNKELEQI